MQMYQPLFLLICKYKSLVMINTVTSIWSWGCLLRLVAVQLWLHLSYLEFCDLAPPLVQHSLTKTTKETCDFHGSSHTLVLVYVIILLFFSFLSAFSKLQKVTVSFVVSVCQFVCMEQFHSHLTNFMKFDIWVFFLNLSTNFKFH